MGTTYTSTIEVNVWKEHTCVGCGTVYRYLFKRKKTGQGGTPDAASKAVQKAVVKALEHETDLQPCPGCGNYQPDMVGAWRSRRHWWVFWLVLPILLVLLILVLTDIVTFSTASWVLAFTGLASIACHLLIDLHNPNRNLEANHALAQRHQEAGDLWVPTDRKPESVDGTPIGTGVGTGHLICYLLLIGAVLGYLVPVGLLLTPQMSANPAWHPEVVGPGEEAYVYFNQKITSLKSMWNGTPRVMVMNLDQLGLAGPPPQFTATTKSDSWGGTIQISGRGSKNGNSTLWARVRIPADNNLVGKSVELAIDMDVRYPASTGGNQWQAHQETFRHRATLTISRAGAGSSYKSLWWFSFLGGLITMSLSGILLAVFSDGFRKKALPTNIFVPQEERMDEEDGEEEERPRRSARLGGEDHGEAEYPGDRNVTRDDERYRR